MNLPQKPKGNSLIDHRIRHELALSCDEYIMADYICRYNKTHKLGEITWRRYYTDIGFEPELVLSTVKSLMIKRIVINTRKRIETTILWNDFFNTDNQFEELWKLYPKGIKNKARIEFLKAINEVHYNTLLEKLQEYIASVQDSDFSVYLSKFLDIKYKYWENDFSNKKKEAVTYEIK